jgi:hypothetical protein
MAEKCPACGGAAYVRPAVILCCDRCGKDKADWLRAENAALRTELAEAKAAACPDDVPRETWLAMRKWWDGFKADDSPKALLKLARETLAAREHGRREGLEEAARLCEQKADATRSVAHWAALREIPYALRRLATQPPAESAAEAGKEGV